MTVHVLHLPDTMARRELREIRWDDVAGTVAGDHEALENIADILATPPPFTTTTPWGTYRLADPAHDPADFLGATFLCVGIARRHHLPPSLRDIKPTQPDPGIIEPGAIY